MTHTNSSYKVDHGGMEEGAEAQSLCAAQADRLSNDGLRSKWNWYHEHPSGLNSSRSRAPRTTILLFCIAGFLSGCAVSHQLRTPIQAPPCLNSMGKLGLKFVSPEDLNPTSPSDRVRVEAQSQLPNVIAEKNVEIAYKPLVEAGCFDSVHLITNDQDGEAMNWLISIQEIHWPISKKNALLNSVSSLLVGASAFLLPGYFLINENFLLKDLRSQREKTYEGRYTFWAHVFILFSPEQKASGNSILGMLEDFVAEGIPQ
jgi:hypothetical protein